MSPGRVIRRLINAVRGHRFAYANEIALQEGLAAAFGAAGLPFKREVCLGPGRADRIDFMVDGVGVEVKVKGSAASVLAQVLRYLEHPEVRGLLLISACCYSERAVNQSINITGPKGKPVKTLILLRGLQ